MSRLRTAVILACLAAATGLAATAAGASSRLDFSDTLKSGTSSSVSVTVSRPAAFRLRLKGPTAGRTRLYLTGAHAPKGGGALLDTTSTGACQGAAGSMICEGSFEALPPGTYKFRILFTGSGTANVALTARW